MKHHFAIVEVTLFSIYNEQSVPGTRSKIDRSGLPLLLQMSEFLPLKLMRAGTREILWQDGGVFL